jgi:glyoxylase-like metal-dependent hydrolase (beta-lactamase superfamily II)
VNPIPVFWPFTMAALQTTVLRPVRIGSYALIVGQAALVYDTHVSVAHAGFIRATLARRGVTQIRVVLSHWHLDHMAGTAAFADSEIIANRRTAGHLATRQAAIEAGCDHGLPAINPLILPNSLFDDRLVLDLAGQPVHLITANIHSDDATLLWLPERRILLAGDTVEDCVTYVGAPQDFVLHLADLARLAALAPAYVLPNHGAPDKIAAGGYGVDIVAATADYIRLLQSGQASPDLTQAIAPDLARGTLTYFAPYQGVHAQNLDRARPFILEKYPAGGAGDAKSPAAPA